MKSVLTAAALALSVATTPMVFAQGENSAAIQGTIQSQIDAFLVDDFARAFSFASPTIKQIFGTPERFGQMVRNGYPMVWRPRDVRFLELREIEGRLWQMVRVEDANGRFFTLDYQMIETSEGWQINGVQLLQPPDVGA